MPAPLRWDEGFDENTVALAYEASKELPELFGNWADALDTKVVATFGVASALLTLVPTLVAMERTRLVTLFLGLALAFWLLASVACLVAYYPAGLRVEPNPKAFLTPSWLTKSPMHFQYARLQWLGETFAHNATELRYKASWLGNAMGLVAIEVFFLALAVILARPHGG